jgi:hypothetical protein
MNTKLNAVMLTSALVLSSAYAQTLKDTGATLPSITTPDRVETRIGSLEYKDCAPSNETVAKLYDHLDLMHGVEALVNVGENSSWNLPPHIDRNKQLDVVAW